MDGAKQPRHVLCAVGPKVEIKEKVPAKSPRHKIHCFALDALANSYNFTRLRTRSTISPQRPR